MTNFSLPNLDVRASEAFQSAAANAGKSKSSKNKLKPFSIRLTVAEREHLRKAAGKQPLGAYVRSVLFDDELTSRQRGRKPVQDRKSIAQVLGLLGKFEIAASMRTLAKAAESGALPMSDHTRDAIDQACADLREIRHMLISALGIKVED